MLRETNSDWAVDLDGLTVEFDGSRILDGISLQVHRGEFVCVLGPSGCGKSTMLRILGGLGAARGGIRVLGGAPDSMYARIAYVFQAPRLLRWRNVLDNVMLGMQLRGMPGGRSVLEHRAKSRLEFVGLGELHDRPAHVLSGGEQQRVALARALAVEPEILLMDEPFSGLDVKTRRELRQELVSIWEQTGLTIVFVTHDVIEAATIGSRVVVFSNKPTRVRCDQRLELPHPRDSASDTFVSICRELMSYLDDTSVR